VSFPIDPKGYLPAIEWRTREAFLELAGKFARKTGLSLQVRSGRRTCAEQNAIYAQGRSTPGEVVTHASGCRSWHVAGRAVDANVLLPNGATSTNEADYAYAGALWKSLGGGWGGDFPGFPDIGHFELHPGFSIDSVCPSDGSCDAITASIQTKTPLYAKMATPLWGSLIGAAAYIGWMKWKGTRS
jgi:hypothetical protein